MQQVAAFEPSRAKGPAMDRGYLQDIKHLESKIDIEEAYIDFEATFEAIRDFFASNVLDASNLHIWGIGQEARDRACFYLDRSFDYQKGRITEEDLPAIQTDAWRDFERFHGADKRLIRLILCCLVGKQAYLHSVDTDMQDNYLSLILVLAFELDEKLGSEFAKFVERHPAMQKYRRATTREQGEGGSDRS